MVLISIRYLGNYFTCESKQICDEDKIFSCYKIMNGSKPLPNV